MALSLLPLPRSLIEGGVGPVPDVEPTTWLDPTLPPQGYRLVTDSTGITVVGADAAGLFYGLATLAQLRRLAARGSVPAVEVRDFPDFATRGVMVDISRDKVPTLATLKDLVTRLASWKLNHLQLYMEHTYAYVGHEEVWNQASPFTAAELDELDEHCRAVHVELAANQNCLGHMERWLAHDRYRPLAITPDGWVDARGRQRAPTTLDPSKPGSLELVRDLLGQLVPLFGSTRVHVGLDEPWELAGERFGDYLGHIAALRAAPELDGREMLIWGDIVAHHPDRAADLPAGVTVAEWGYEANHPFEERAAVLAAAGRDLWLCPGTSSWNTLLGRTTNMRDNVTAAAAVGRDARAAGLLVTDWGDNGHLQYLPVSEPGLAWTAAASWCEASSRRLDLPEALGLHVFDDPSGRLGRALLALGDAHRLVEPQLPNMSILALPLYSPNLRMGEGWTEGLTDGDLAAAAAALDAGAAEVAASRSDRPDASLITDEVVASAALLGVCVADARRRLAGADGPAADLAAQVDDLIARHRDLWLTRNRPGGLDDSVARLERYRERLR